MSYDQVSRNAAQDQSSSTVDPSKTVNRCAPHPKLGAIYFASMLVAAPLAARSARNVTNNIKASMMVAASTP